MAVLLSSALWWLWVQLARIGWLSVGSLSLSPSLGHGVVMVYGFMPLFFTGFLFTAGPKWLGIESPRAREILPSVILQALAWQVWIAGVHLSATVALAGLALGLTGQALSSARFLKMLLTSNAEDRVHAWMVTVGCCVGSLSLAGLFFAVLRDDQEWARRILQTGLWGFIALIYVTVVHRMVPFFTSAALPRVELWRPTWVLNFLVAMVGIKAAEPWLMQVGLDSAIFRVGEGFVLLVASFLLLWLAFVWGLMQSLSIPLLAMLHIGFVWLGLGMALDSLSLLWSWVSGEQLSPMASLHATTLGFLGSIMLAMVTRVSCGHGGRRLVADRGIWWAFLLLQLTTLLRVVAALAPPDWISQLTVAAAFGWVAVVLPWGLRMTFWYGLPRADGRSD